MTTFLTRAIGPPTFIDMHRNPSPIARSIIVIVVFFFMTQIAMILGTAYALDLLGRPVTMVFLGISLPYHGLLLGLLLRKKDDFRLVEGEKPLTRVNLSNFLTITRITSLPAALFLILAARNHPLLHVLVPFLSVIFLTDLLDGLIARRTGQITVIGRYLDSVSDYAVIVGISIAFFAYRLVPVWLFTLILARLVLFAAAMIGISLRAGKISGEATFLGKACVFSIMVLYIVEALEFFRVPLLGNIVLVRIIEWATAAVVSASVVDKALYLWRVTGNREKRD
jgi:cardiolipin synthase (CMP-forming)